VREGPENSGTMRRCCAQVVKERFFSLLSVLVLVMKHPGIVALAFSPAVVGASRRRLAAAGAMRQVLFRYLHETQ